MRLDHREQPSGRVDEPGEVQPAHLGCSDAPVQRQPATVDRDQRGGQEGQGDLVAGGVDDVVDGRLGSVDEAHAVTAEPSDCGLDGDIAAPHVTEPAEKVLALKLAVFADVIADVTGTLEPHRLCTYLFALAGGSPASTKGAQS